MRLTFIFLLALLLALSSKVVQASEIKGEITVTEAGTQTTYHITAQHLEGYGTRVLLSSNDEDFLDVNLSVGNIPDSFFAKIILMGVMDPFLAMEILWGDGETLCRPYMLENGDTMTFRIKPEDAIGLYEQYAEQAMLSTASAEILRQLVTALEPELSYSFQTEGDVTKITMKSKTSVPDARYANGVILVQHQYFPTLVQHQAQLPSYE